MLDTWLPFQHANGPVSNGQNAAKLAVEAEEPEYELKLEAQDVLEKELIEDRANLKDARQKVSQISSCLFSLSEIILFWNRKISLK